MMNDLNVKLEASRKRVMAIAMRFTRNHEAAEDLTQDVLMKVFENIDRFDESKADFETWVAVVAKRTCVDQFRRTKREKETINVFADIETMHVEAKVQSQDDQVLEGELMQAVSQLDQNLKSVVIGTLNGQSYEEIASELSMNVGTVKSRMNRSKSELRAALNV